MSRWNGQQPVEQADIRHHVTCTTARSRPETKECGTLLAILPQQDACSEATKRLVVKDGYRKNISCLRTEVSLTAQCLLFICSEIKLGNCFGSHKILTGFVGFKVIYFYSIMPVMGHSK